MLVPLSPSAADNKLPNYNLQTLRFQRRGRGKKINEINLKWTHFLCLLCHSNCTRYLYRPAYLSSPVLPSKQINKTKNKIKASAIFMISQRRGTDLRMLGLEKDLKTHFLWHRGPCRVSMHTREGCRLCKDPH